MRKVKVNICGRIYCLNTEENEEYVTGLAAGLNERITRFMNENPGTSVLSAAIMTALELSDDASRNEGDADNFRLQLKNYAEEAATARVNADKLRRAVEALLLENRKLKSDLELLTLRNQVEKNSIDESDSSSAKTESANQNASK
ncbi:MAG TPA: cell division protein ZapA [Candidatus Faecivivens stercoripullorum]|uniref:Cell division protein ZapA n=1 Tax=Candidatus Faecivivens stercoripullorum TaxID=2840805 RepID=A0A9D1H4P5_9FIRM|nr:cell division protein ZapA [Candidatus Faecivivens stercoripullorum]